MPVAMGRAALLLFLALIWLCARKGENASPSTDTKLTSHARKVQVYQKGSLAFVNLQRNT
jgi:hypothetical protein